MVFKNVNTRFQDSYWIMFMPFFWEHWKHLRTNNVLERLMRKIRRRPYEKNAPDISEHDGLLKRMCEKDLTLPINDY